MLFLKNEKLSVILLILLRDEVQDAFNGNYFVEYLLNFMNMQP